MAQKIPFFELFTDFSPDFDLRVPLNAAVVTNMVLEPEKRTMTLDMTVRAEMTDSTRETVEQMLARSYDLKRVDIHVKSTAEAFPDMMKNAGRKVSGSGSVIMGREIAKGRVLPISELTPKAGHVVVEGKVFKFDCHETRRAGVWTMLLEMTDYEGSLIIRRSLPEREAVELNGKIATYFTVNEAGRITETRCAPHKASGCRSLEIYLLSRDLLISLVDECAAQDKYSFRSDVLCAMGDKLDLRAFLWDGFAAQLRTVQEYYERSMQLLNPAVRAELFCAERPILAKEDDEAASYIAPDSHCVDSLIADGCQIEGSVEGSILFPGVKVGKGSSVKNCILFKNTVVEDGVTLRCVIADKDVRVRGGGTLIGHESYPLVVSKGSVI